MKQKLKIKNGKKKRGGKKREKKKKRRMKLVATTSLPAVDRPNADRWNAASSHQLLLVHAYRMYGGNVRF